MTELKSLASGLHEWIVGSQPGSRIIYHTGQSAGGSTCRDAMAAYDAGLIILIRKRADKPGLFHYIAHRTGQTARGVMPPAPAEEDVKPKRDMGRIVGWRK